MADEVDALVEDWRRERPDLQVDSMQVWSRIHRVAALFETGRRRVFRECGLEGWEFDVLAALRKAGAKVGLSPGDLMRDTHVTSGTMTNRIERLRQREFITREADPKDRRSAVILLTDAGRDRVDRAIASLLVWEQELLTNFAADEQSELADLLRKALRAWGQPES